MDRMLHLNCNRIGFHFECARGDCLCQGDDHQPDPWPRDLAQLVRPKTIYSTDLVSAMLQRLGPGGCCSPPVIGIEYVV
jgi:hypothetical protein